MTDTYSIKKGTTEYRRSIMQGNICWLSQAAFTRGWVEVNPKMAVELEKEYLEETLYKPATKYAEIEWPIDDWEEEYNPIGLVKYNAYIAGWMACLDQHKTLVS